MTRGYPTVRGFDCGKHTASVAAPSPRHSDQGTESVSAEQVFFVRLFDLFLFHPLMHAVHLVAGETLRKDVLTLLGAV